MAQTEANVMMPPTLPPEGTATQQPHELPPNGGRNTASKGKAQSSREPTDAPSRKQGWQCQLRVQHPGSITSQEESPW